MKTTCCKKIVATKPTKQTPRNNKPTMFSDRNIARLRKKTGPVQIRTQDLCRPRRIRYFQTKHAEDAQKLNSLRAKRPSDS